MNSRLELLYKEDIAKKMQEKFGYESVMQVPKILKITLSMGLGKFCRDKKAIETALQVLYMVSGQMPAETYARKSIAGFGTREGWCIGGMVTLRRKKMYEFLDRLISIYLPRVRDFQGISRKSFDGKSGINLGIKESIVCPEVNYDNADSVNGFNISIATDAKTKEELFYLLKMFNFPLQN